MSANMESRKLFAQRVVDAVATQRTEALDREAMLVAKVGLLQEGLAEARARIADLEAAEALRVEAKAARSQARKKPAKKKSARP